MNSFHFLVLLIFAASTLTGGAAISMEMAGTGLQTFDTPPPVTQWATLTVGSGSGTVRSPDDMDAAVQQLSASEIATPLPTSSAIPPSQNNAARWNTVERYLETKPAGNAYTVLMAVLSNDTGAEVTAVSMSYDLGEDLRGIFGPEPVRGYRSYYSLSGTTGSWTLIPQFSTADAATLTANLDLFIPWPVGGPLYVIWADDNATTETDGAYTIDNFMAVVPRRSHVISVRPDGTGTNTFDVYQHPTNGWSTISVIGSQTNVTTAAALDATVQLLAATNVNGLLWREYTWPPSNDGGNATASYNHVGFFLQTQPSGNSCITLMATLQNDSGDSIAALNVGYEFTVAVTNANEAIYGHRVYLSLTGLPGSWRPILSTETSGQVNAHLDLGSWRHGSALYLLWADDNGPSESGQDPPVAEGVYIIDNFFAYPATPEPRVRVVRVNGMRLDIAWPYTASEYQLQGTTDLDALDWVFVSGSASSASGFHRVSVFAPSGTAFFRLMKM